CEPGAFWTTSSSSFSRRRNRDSSASNSARRFPISFLRIRSSGAASPSVFCSRSFSVTHLLDAIVSLLDAVELTLHYRNNVVRQLSTVHCFAVSARRRVFASLTIRKNCVIVLTR